MIQTATSVRRRLFDPPNAVADRPLVMRNGKAVDCALLQIVRVETIPPATINPLPVVSRETFLKPGRHLGLACLRGQRPQILPRYLPRGILVANIVVLAAEEFHVTAEEILSPARFANVVLPRQVVAYLARNMTRLSMPKIGKHLGDRDHTTILSAIRKITRMVDQDQEFAGRVNKVRRRVLETVQE